MAIFNSYVKLPEGTQVYESSPYGFTVKFLDSAPLGRGWQSQGATASRAIACDCLVDRTPIFTRLSGRYIELVHWPSQEPIDWRYLPYIRPIFQAYVRGYTSRIWPYMVLTYLHFRILEWPLIYNQFKSFETTHFFPQGSRCHWRCLTCHGWCRCTSDTIGNFSRTTGGFNHQQ